MPLSSALTGRHGYDQWVAGICATLRAMPETEMTRVSKSPTRSLKEEGCPPPPGGGAKGGRGIKRTKYYHSRGRPHGVDCTTVPSPGQLLRGNRQTQGTTR